jgi:hypothetical protein
MRLLILDEAAEDDLYILTAMGVCVVRLSGSPLAASVLQSRKKQGCYRACDMGEIHLTV